MSFDLKLKNGDLVISQGQLQTVINTDKLIQDILKICLTPVGSNPLHPWYGSSISKTIIGSPLYNNILVQIAKSQLTSSIENLKGLQEGQIRAFQKCSANEHIGSIIDISVTRNQADLRFFNVTIKVLSKGLAPLATSFTINPI